MGPEAYLEEQLNPDTLDDSEAEARLAQMPILDMDRQTLYEMHEGKSRCKKALVEGALLRATHSRRQLETRMMEFWSDHFNVASDHDIAPDVVQFMQDIRKHALGKFRDLLFASARAPAMLYYLNNASSTAEAPNENYARELMELHTLGVDGPYTESDVKDVARAFTGWTTHKRTAEGFYFNPEEHDTGKKTILGHSFPTERGIEDGLHVLSLLAKHESTASFLSRKLAVKFVSDEPPQSLVEQLSKVWLESGGDIKTVLRALFVSEEFQAAKGQKLRRPLEFYIGSLRATGAKFTKSWPQKVMLEDLGQEPYAWEPPNGYPDVARAWLSGNGLLARWNVAMRLTHGAASTENQSWDIRSTLHERIPEVNTVTELVSEVSKQVFGYVLPETELEPFIHYASDGVGGLEPVTVFLRARKLNSLYGLMLASPAFQWI